MGCIVTLDEKMLSLQELRSMQPSRVHKVVVTMKDVITGKFEVTAKNDLR